MFYLKLFLSIAIFVVNLFSVWCVQYAVSFQAFSKTATHAFNLWKFFLLMEMGIPTWDLAQQEKTELHVVCMCRGKRLGLWGSKLPTIEKCVQHFQFGNGSNDPWKGRWGWGKFSQKELGHEQCNYNDDFPCLFAQITLKGGMQK